MADKDLFDLKRLQARDPSVLETLVREHTQVLYRASLGLGFPLADAEELTQNVWTTFMEVVPRFEGRSSVRTFLFGILYKKASEMRKKSGRMSHEANIEKIVDEKFDQDGHWIEPPLDPEKFLQSTQNLKLISQCLELLPENQKLAFTMKEVLEEESEHICQSLEISISNLGVLLFRARHQLRECIERKSK